MQTSKDNGKGNERVFQGPGFPLLVPAHCRQHVHNSLWLNHNKYKTMQYKPLFIMQYSPINSTYSLKSNWYRCKNYVNLVIPSPDLVGAPRSWLNTLFLPNDLPVIPSRRIRRGCREVGEWSRDTGTTRVLKKINLYEVPEKLEKSQCVSEYTYSFWADFCSSCAL